MKCLVIGYGSIGRRHTGILKKLGCQISLLTQQAVPDTVTFTSLDTALQEKYDSIIIANETALHYPVLSEIIKSNFTGRILIEKPLFNDYQQIPNDYLNRIFVAYNLRFHPILQFIRNLLKHQRIISFTIHTGQYLPTWRPDRDYRTTYSAKQHLGGGVLRDLSHELDYACWLGGNPHRLTAIGGKLSHLEITSDDVFSILMKTERCPLVSLHINYLDRMPMRKIIINTEQHTIMADLMKNVLNINNEEHKIEMQDTYTCQLQDFLNHEDDTLCTAEEGLTCIELIKKIEQANTSKTWVAQ